MNLSSSKSAVLPVVSAPASAPTPRASALAEFITIAVKSTAAATGSAETARFLLAGFINRQGTAIQNLPVQLINGSFHVGLGSQFHECKASRTAGFMITHHPDVLDRNTGVGEEFGQPGICYTERQISNEKLIGHRASICLDNSIEIEEGEFRLARSPQKRSKLDIRTTAF
jgi:hypothetical protein